MQHSLPIKLSRLLSASLAILLAACVSTSTAPGSGPASVSRAERLTQQGNPAGAAQMYERLAQDNPPPGRNDFTLAAARAWLTANRADDAQRVIEAAGSEFTAAQTFERELLGAEIAMARGQYAPAWKQIADVAEPRKPADAARLFLLQQQVALRAGQPLDGVRAGIARERVATSDTDRSRARRDLLTDLRAAIDRGLRIDPAAARDALVRGWLEIGQIAASAGRSPLSAAPAIERWRSRFPGHPAASIATSEIIVPGDRPARGPASAVASNTPIGLLLPLSGRQTAATAALVRDGFLAAVARLPEGTRPVVRIYDTDALSVGTAMQNARAEGAGFLVGPLTRTEVQTAAEQRPADLPLLLLNNLDGSGYVGAQLYQYALAPEDEARQIARQMFGAGQRRALVVAPSGEWGTRVAAAFTDELTKAGGQVVAQGNYDLARNDMTTTINSLLGIDASRARFKRVQQITNSELVFEARPRPDFDAIFAAGYQSLALRQINPQLLQFFSAGSLPVYITQQGLDTETQANRDLEGMRVLDMPWMLESVGPAADLRTATESSWSARGLAQSRYFAFGYDAAVLAMAIRNGSSNWPLAGLTGRLNLNADGRVERSLNWARMRDGATQPFDPVTQ